MTKAKTLLVVMPMTFSSISTRVFKSFLDLIGPKAQRDLMDKHGLEIKTRISGTFPLDRNRNEAAYETLSEGTADYIFWADGDQIWPSNTLLTLLDRASSDYPVVSGLYWRKAAPYACVQGMFGDTAKQMNRMETIKGMGFVDAEGRQTLFYTPLQDFDTARAIDVSGMGCLLTKTEVFGKIDLPYFGYFNSFSLGGDFTIDHCSEEMLFFSKLHKAGIKMMLAPSVKCGHEVTKVIGSPERED